MPIRNFHLHCQIVAFQIVEIFKHDGIGSETIQQYWFSE